MPKPEKIKQVKELKEKIQQIKTLVVVDFKGLNVQDINKFRIQLKQNNTQLQVVKNTLFSRACREQGIENSEEIFKEQSAVIWDNQSQTQGAKTAYEFSKSNENLKIKGGILEGKIIDFEKVKQLAMLPNKEVLLSQLLNTLQAPLRNLLSVLQAKNRDLVLVLQSIQHKINKN